jgi:hypothetical protein
MRLNRWLGLGIAVALLIITVVLTGLLRNGEDEKAMSMPKQGTAQPVEMQTETPKERPFQISESMVHVQVDLSGLDQTLENKFTDLNQWELGMDWLSSALVHSEEYMRTKYPFVKRVQLMSATGGSKDRDLFINPLDREQLTDYDFSRLGTAVQHILRQGLTPSIVTGNVPLKYSSDALIGGFGVNVRPPDDFDVYYNYIKALADYMVDRFGLEEVRTWTWRALVEYENVDWFNAGDTESTKEAYFKLYDYTVAALESVVGSEHLYIGAHSMTNAEGYWDEREFIDHVAFGTNYYTGQQGTQLDFLTFSYYDLKPGLRSPAPFTLESNLNLLRERAIENGLTDLEYGVDEGRIASGPDNKELFPRTVASSYQSAYDAKLFKQMHDIDLDYFANWYLNTERLWEGVTGVDPVGTHLANLVYRMEGAQRVAVSASKPITLVSNEVDGIGAYHTSTGTAQLLLYNFNEDPEAGVSEQIAITFDNLEAVQGDTVTVKQWIIDDEHANYWPKWLAYLEEQGVVEGDFGGWSSHSWTISSIASQKIQKYWYDHVEEFRELSKLEATETAAEIRDNKLVLSQVLAPQGVIFYEISGVKQLDS